MSTDDLTKNIEDFILHTYEQIAIKPAIFSGYEGCINAYIFALEGVLEYLHKQKTQQTGLVRSKSYAEFLKKQGFGPVPFIAHFGRLHGCRHGFVEVADVKSAEASKSLEADFHEAFQEHWQQYLSWRSNFSDSE